MLCRTILMGADKNKPFAYYVDYLKDKQYITPMMKKMADTIRNNGNRAVHEINSVSQERAKYTLQFTWHILTSMYGAEHDFSKYQSR